MKIALWTILAASLTTNAFISAHQTGTLDTVSNIINAVLVLGTLTGLVMLRRTGGRSRSQAV